MKQALILGGASKNSQVILSTLLNHDFHIVNFGSSTYPHDGVTNVQISWDQLDIEFVQRNFGAFAQPFDFVFFNQNGSSLSLSDYSTDHDDILEVWRRIKDWNHSHWVSCQLPFLILHTIRNNLTAQSKVGWMLSEYIDHTNAHSVDFADYSSAKYFNYLSMKSFGMMNQFQTFGIYPDFSDPNAPTKLQQIITDIVESAVIKDQYQF
jgi:hypothetical protein